VSKIGKWLESQEAHDVLARVARSIMRHWRSTGLSLSLFPQDRRRDDPIDDLLNEIRSELSLFVLESRSRLQEMLASGDKNCHCYLKAAFINHQIDNVRGPDKDRKRYLHNRIADLLRKSPDFFTFVRNRQLLAFSMANESILIQPLSLEDIEGIPFPHDIVEELEYEHINKKDVLLKLAAYFWNQASNMWADKPVQVYLRDFVDWIGLHVSIKSMAKINRLADGDNPIDFVEDNQRRPDRECFDPELVKIWAQNFANRLSRKEKAVFHLRCGVELTLEDTALKLGLKGPSGPAYHEGKAKEKLRSFLRDLPWLSLDDLNEEAFSLFCDTLFSILKKSVPES